MSHLETQRSCQELYQGRIFTLTQHEVTLENGKTALRDVVNHHGGACVAALDSQNRLLLVRQYRFPTKGELLELPAGKLEAGEDPKAAAFRELEEETGFTTHTLEELSTIWPTPAYCTEVIHIYEAGALTPSVQRLDPDEFLDVVPVPFEEAVEMVLTGRILDAKTQVAILMMEARRHSIKKEITP